MRKICVFIGSRANYSSIKSAMIAIQNHPDLELLVILGASALLDRYGSVAELIKKDGFKVDEEVFMLLEGETPSTMAKSTGIGLIELPTIFDRLRPDVVLTVGDRFETMATTLAASYMNIAVAHTMGGEVSGTIDESIRHAVTKFAHIHFPASQDAKERIVKLGESLDSVHMVGCPRIDLVAEIINNASNELNILQDDGVGSKIDFDKPFLIVSQHPVTTEYGHGEKQIRETLEAVRKTGMQAIILWPNSDAGAEDISRGIRKFREEGCAQNMHFFKNLPVSDYIQLMNRTACLVGNSSSGIREGAFIGTPVVNIGNRQNRRQHGRNVINTDYKCSEIYNALIKQIENGKYPSENIYGDGNAGNRIANILSSCSWSIQKVISY